LSISPPAATGAGVIVFDTIARKAQRLDPIEGLLDPIEALRYE